MNEAIIENYLSIIQEEEPEYMTEGIREFVAKFDRQMLKRTVDKLYMAFTRGDEKTFSQVAKNTAKIGKVPKYQEVQTFMGNIQKEHPEIQRSVDLAKKVMKNTFKIKDKAKLEILANAVGMTSWIKTKGGRKDVVQATKESLKKIHTDVMNIYDSGFEGAPEDTEEEQELKRKMQETAKKQEKIEFVVVAIVLFALVAAIIWVGITIWGIMTSPVVMGVGAIVTMLVFFLKHALFYLTTAVGMYMSIMAYLKTRG